MTDGALLKVIRQNPLFEGMSDAEAEEELKDYDARQQEYARGETVIRLGSPVSRLASKSRRMPSSWRPWKA